jgi:hypothetical protein
LVKVALEVALDELEDDEEVFAAEEDDEVV